MAYTDSLNERANVSYQVMQSSCEPVESEIQRYQTSSPC
ncbi:hypothetical protein IHE45_04G183300 [Dioscorea alata]|uniref:Uncharacterized protein n=1 Tax=Dioscorea alata TaxID=55571 RepID=A0ACB7WIS0_DIOAL|nr:hypothetical protein IHE45_04G183300 [Dioscorea alata]